VSSGTPNRTAQATVGGSSDPVQRMRSAFVSAVTDIFASLPPRAAAIETDAVSPLPRPPARPVVELIFRKPHQTPPKVVCWLLLKPSEGTAGTTTAAAASTSTSADPGLLRVKASSVAVSVKGAVVSLPAEAASNPKAVLFWFAFATQKTNPVLTATL
jgi:hypothetical protein